MQISTRNAESVIQLQLHFLRTRKMKKKIRTMPCRMLYLYHPAGTSFLFSFPLPLPHSLSLPTVTIYFFNSMFFKLYPVCISLGLNLSYPIPFALILSILYRPIDVSNIYLFIPLFIHYFINSFTFSFYIFLTNSTSLYFRWI